MTTSILQPPTRPALANEREALRLDLSAPAARGAVDGSWWPQSHDLTIEIPDLVDHFPKERGQVHRVVFSRPDWDTAPPHASRSRQDQGRLLPARRHPPGLAVDVDPGADPAVRAGAGGCVGTCSPDLSDGSGSPRAGSPPPTSRTPMPRSTARTTAAPGGLPTTWRPHSGPRASSCRT